MHPDLEDIKEKQLYLYELAKTRDHFFINIGKSLNGEYSEHFYLHWDLRIKAPVSKIMNHEEAIQYGEDWGYNQDNCFSGPYNQEVLKPILSNNHAGPNGRHATWSQILELYR